MRKNGEKFHFQCSSFSRDTLMHDSSFGEWQRQTENTPMSVASDLVICVQTVRHRRTHH